jgi:ERCC4-type nuclease
MQRGRRAPFHAKVSLEEESGPEENGNSNYISFKGCPGRANRLLETFDSVEAVVTATTARLAEVHGIGIKTAQSIRWSVTP